MALLRIEDLPEGALDAAARFHEVWLPRIRALIPLASGEDLLVAFPSEDHTHRAWRLAAVQQLARELAPIRINAVASDQAAPVACAQEYLASAPGVTGQYLPLDGNAAGQVLYRSV